MALSSTLTDTFDGTLQPKWNHSTPPAAGTSGGRAFLAAAHTGGTPAFNIIFSNGTYSFDVFSARVFPAAANGATGGAIVTTELEINSATSGTRVSFLIDTVNNQLRAYNQVGGADTPTSATYSSTNHAYLRMRLSGNALLYETSANGFTWAVFRTVTPAPAWLSSEQIVPTLRTTRNAGTNNNAEFDNVNVVPSFPATSTLIDKFDTDPFNARWTAPSAPNAQIVGGRAQVLASHVNGTADRYRVVAASDCVFDSFSAQVFPPASAGATAGFQVTAEIECEHPTTPGKRVAMLIDSVSNLVYCYEQTNFVDPNVVTFAYDAAQHGFLRMRISAGALLWETSPDGRTTTWTTRRSLNPAPAWLTTELVRPGLRATRTVGTNNYAEFDNVNFATPVTGGGTGTGGMGFNWPNMVVTYVNHWDQQSTTYANRAHPLAVAQTNGVKVMRTFFGTIDSIQQIKSPVQATRDQAWAGLAEILDTAAAYGVRIVLSNYLTQETIGALAGTTFGSWTAARQAVTTPNSAAWLGLQDWLAQALSRFAAHPGVFSWEVTNEPGYMLGIDDGSIPRDQGCSFLNTFQLFLKNNGAQVVNAGGRVLFDKTLLTDTQVITATQNVDWLDDHFYSDTGNAATHLAAMDTWVARVNTLLGRTMKVMIGEYGTDQPFFDDLTSGIVSRGWLPLTWGWDAFDSNIFNDTTKTYVVTKLNTVNAAATPATDVTVTSRFQGIRVGRPGASVLAPAPTVPSGWDEVRLYAPEGISGTVGGGGVDSPIHSGNALTGVTGNNSTDNSTPFLNAFSTVAGGIQNYSTLSVNRQGTKTIELPPGAFVVTSADALMRDLGIPRTAGLTIRGAGRDLTKLVFSPTVANSYLLTNNEDFYHITFEDLTFHSTVASASFMHSTSTGGPQNYVFNRCNWRGSWTYGLNLDGTNVNSEMTWFHCGIYGDWTAFLYVGSGGSDQFVNYNFFACQVEYATGNFVDMTYGGNINVWGGSLIHVGNATATTSSAQCFFRLRTGDHAGGTERLKVVGARIEHRHTASQLINCDWKRGVISFDNIHTDATNSIVGNDTSVISAEFGGAGNEMSIISFRDSLLLGKHKYHYTSNSASFVKRVNYENCRIQSFDTAAQFITYTNDDANSNVASAPQIVFRNCKGDDLETSFDCTLNWQVASPGTPQKHMLSMKRFIGTLPVSGGTLTEQIPINSLITRVRSGKGVIGSSTSTNFTYTLTDGNGATIATAAGNGSTTWANGYNYDSGALSRFCNTDAERTLTVTSANITEGTTESFFWVEYLA